MSRIAAFVLLFAVIGLIAGYLLFARVGNGYIKPTNLFQSDDRPVRGLLQQAAGIPKIRTNILITGAVGAGLGFLLSVVLGRRR